MYYFAYGSNMLRSRLEERLHTVEDLGIATLIGYKIAFNKESIHGSGKTNIIPFGGDSVLGVVFGLTKEQFDILDNLEVGYNRTSISARMDNNLVEMETYIAKENCINNALLPVRKYQQYLIDGAIEHMFPQSYIEMLKAFPIID